MSERRRLRVVQWTAGNVARETVRAVATEVIQIAMLRPHELDVDVGVLMAARPPGIDQELNIDALYVHIAEAPSGIPVVGV